MGLNTGDVRTRKHRAWAAFVRWIAHEISGSTVYSVSFATSRSVRHMFLSVHFSLFNTLTPLAADTACLRSFTGFLHLKIPIENADWYEAHMSHREPRSPMGPVPRRAHHAESCHPLRGEKVLKT